MKNSITDKKMERKIMTNEWQSGTANTCDINLRIEKSCSALKQMLRNRYSCRIVCTDEFCLAKTLWYHLKF